MDANVAAQIEQNDCLTRQQFAAVLGGIDPNEHLSRQQLAEALTALGLPIKAGTLAAMASRGEGPPYVIWGRLPRYSLKGGIAWAQRRLDAPPRHAAPDESAASRATA